MSSGYLVAAIALSFEGVAKGSPEHKHILSVYNSVKPYGYTMRESDPWCAAFWTACQIMAGNINVPMSASCSKIITEAKNLGVWQEKESVTPKVGWGVLYDWSDGSNYASYDNKSDPDHIGIVYDVDDDYIYVIEGNKGNGVVGKRAVKKNGRYLRGFVKPNYSSLKKSSYVPKKAFIGKVPTKDVKYGDSGTQVKLLQKYLNYMLGLDLKVDGDCGVATTNAILIFEKTFGLECDGWFGAECRQKGRALLISRNAVAMAWASGTEKTKYYVAKGGKPNAEFQRVWKAIYGNKKWNCGCHSFVKLVLRASGYKSAMPSLKWAKIVSWFKSNMKSVKVKFKQSQIEEGDIRIYRKGSSSYHIWINADVNGKMIRVEANQGGEKKKQRYAHVTTANALNSKKHKSDWLFRAR